MQTAFFKLADIIPIEDAVKYLKDAVEKNYSRKGREIVENNDRAIDSSLEKIVKVDAGNISAGSGTETGTEDYPEYYKNFVLPILKQEGDDLPVSAFVGYEDGTYEIGTTKYEKRGISLHDFAGFARSGFNVDIGNYRRNDVFRFQHRIFEAQVFYYFEFECYFSRDFKSCHTDFSVAHNSMPTENILRAFADPDPGSI